MDTWPAWVPHKTTSHASHAGTHFLETHDRAEQLIKRLGELDHEYRDIHDQNNLIVAKPHEKLSREQEASYGQTQR